MIIKLGWDKTSWIGKHVLSLQKHHLNKLTYSLWYPLPSSQLFDTDTNEGTSRQEEDNSLYP